MGPAQRQDRSSDFPNRPKFSWDILNAPWTDGIGPHIQYAEAVADWSKLHDIKVRSADKDNAIANNLRGIMLRSHLYGRARDLARCVSDEQLESDQGHQHIVNAIYKCDALSRLTNIFSDFNALVSARRSDNEQYSKFENRFAALVSKFNSHSKTFALPEPLTAFLLLWSAQIQDAQRLSILSNIAREIESTSAEVAAGASKDSIEDVSYESVAKILRQCVNEKSNRRPLQPLGAHAGGLGGGRRVGRGGGRGGRGGGSSGTGMSAEELRIAKMANACHHCRSKGKLIFGHWASDHNPDDSLKPGATSVELPTTNINANAASIPLPSFNNGNKNNTNNNNTNTGASADQPPNQPTKRTTFGFSSQLITSHNVMSAGINHGGIASFPQIGPLVDDGAPFSAIGEVELRLIAPRLIAPSPKIEPKPSKLSRFDLWQYGSGTHASQAKRILGSVNILVRTDDNNLVAVRHLLIEGSSPWVIGRNITSQCSIEHIGRNALRLPSTSRPDYISMSDDLFHSYIPLSRFLLEADPRSPQLGALSGSTAALRPIASEWPRVRRIVDRVHKHICGHAAFSDMRTLLTPNRLWSPQVQAYLVEKVNTCTNCLASSTPPPNRRVSLSSLDRAFNNVIAIDHFFLEELVFFHAMDTATRFSTAHVVTSTNMDEAIYALESMWISQFWPPSKIHADGAFQNKEFEKFLSMHDISLIPVPPRRHQKNMAEPRHGIIRVVYLRLRQANSGLSPAISAIQAVRITNDLYGNDVASAFELEKGFTRPIEKGFGITSLPHDLHEAHLDITARRKLNLILHSHSHEINQNFRIGDLVQMYIKNSSDKRGSWTAPRQILSMNVEGGFLTVAGRAGKTVTAAFEDARVAPKIESLYQAVQDAIEDLEERLDKQLHESLDDE